MSKPQTTKSDFERGAEAMKERILSDLWRDDMPSGWKCRAEDVIRRSYVEDRTS
jgi:hypothetical protein